MIQAIIKCNFFNALHAGFRKFIFIVSGNSGKYLDEPGLREHKACDDKSIINRMLLELGETNHAKMKPILSHDEWPTINYSEDVATIQKKIIILTRGEYSNGLV